MRAALLLVLAATALRAQSAPQPLQTTRLPPIVLPDSMPAPPASPIDPFRFLLGTWTATTTAGSSRAIANGEYTFHTDLNATIVTRSTSADTCVAPQAFNCQHHDLLTLYREPGDPTWRALSLDNEGHTIHYRVTFPEADAVTFVSIGPGLQYRLAYHLVNGIMTGKFQWAPAGTGAYRSYLEWAGGHPASHTAASNGPFTSSIEALRDTNRILLVFAPSSSDPQFVQQLAQFKAHEQEVMNRALIVVPVLGRWAPRDAPLYEANLPFSVEREQDYLRTRFKVSPTTFTVILIGKDGGEKSRAHTLVEAKSLFETVDSMPMRRLEMQGRGKEPRSR